MQTKKFDCEFIVVPYKNNNISKDAAAIIKGNYNAVIVGAASSRDISYLESLTLSVPLLFINRSSSKYSTVGVDNDGLSQMAAELFKKKGYKEICVISSAQKYLATARRTDIFLKACSSLGISVPDRNILQIENTQEGGIYAAKIFAENFLGKVKAVFCVSDTIAFGMVYQFNRLGVKIPGDLEFLTIAMTEPYNTSYYTPSISSISMPTDKIAALAVDITIDSLSKHSPEPHHELVDPVINLCESFSLLE
ncbi:MAG: LacI family transcriptional regulator [Treponema sp.]|jgi:DNA-binding LacI/PurR family transcriptional regulator|nr:LacI family transcriptional regulator [Treponema sp.]